MDKRDPLKKNIKVAEIIDINGRQALIENLGEPEEGKKVHKIDPNVTIFKMMRKKIDKLLEDYISFYYPRGGRGIKVTIEVEKEGSTETHSEEFEYLDTMKVTHIVGIK